MSVFLEDVQNKKLAGEEVERKSHHEADAEHKHHYQGKFIVFFRKVNEDA
jgi:hypothetical protein